MKLVSTTLTGNNESVIGDAVASVAPWVDACIVIDTGVTDGSLRVARDAAKDKYVLRSFKWIDDFAAARNFALDAAHAYGATWAFGVDTDERIQTNGEDVRAVLAASPDVEIFMVTHWSETHVRERVFRLPVTSRFTGPTHEAFPGVKKFGVLEKTRCFELDKTPEQYQKKFERDARILAAYTQENPWDPRWFYYLGDALQNLRRFDEAIRPYEECASLRGWNEESAWACYRAAECWCALKKFDKAVDACATGLARHSGIAELAWLAGYASWELGRADQAIWWSHLAIAMGSFRGKQAVVKRIGFKNLRALYEGPYDVLRFALRAVGDAAGADEAERVMHEATKAREGLGKT